MFICNLSKWSLFEAWIPSFDREIHSASFGTCFQFLFPTILKLRTDQNIVKSCPILMISRPFWSQWWDLSSEIMLICNLSKWSPFETRTPSFDREFHSASFGTCFQQLFLTSLDDFYSIFRWLLGKNMGAFGGNFLTHLGQFGDHLGTSLG